MSGHQRMFENIKGKPVDMEEICKKEKWIKAYVRTEGGCFAFSDVETADNFAGKGDKAVGTVTVV